MKKTRIQKGITLIALIITIVVLLILAGVTIASIRDEDILGHAATAVNEYKKGEAKEQNTLQNTITFFEDNTTLKVGSYIKYPVEYTTSKRTCWRVLSIEGTGENTYLRLVSAGTPLTYTNNDSATFTENNLNDIVGNSVADLTSASSVFNLPIDRTGNTERAFSRCAFNVDTMQELKTLFTNEYTNINSVRLMNKSDIRSVVGDTVSLEGTNEVNLSKWDVLVSEQHYLLADNMSSAHSMPEVSPIGNFYNDTSRWYGPVRIVLDLVPGLEFKQVGLGVWEIVTE